MRTTARIGRLRIQQCKSRARDNGYGDGTGKSGIISNSRPKHRNGFHCHEQKISGRQHHVSNTIKSTVVINALLAATQGAAATNNPHNATTKREQLPIDPRGYCWSHGYKVCQGHTSKTCGGNLQGHQDEATRTNKLGRKMWNKPDD